MDTRSILGEAIDFAWIVSLCKALAVDPNSKATTICGDILQRALGVLL